MNVWRIRDDLFIRGMFDKRPEKLQELQDLGVSSVICMLRKTDPDLQNINWLEYRNFPLPDAKYVKKDALWFAASHAAREIKQGKKVLVHCIAARDRCPSVAAVTLCILEGVSGIEAIQRVKTKKPNTFFNQALRTYISEIPTQGYFYYKTGEGRTILTNLGNT